MHDNADGYAVERTVQYLYDCARRAVRRSQEQKHRSELLEPAANKVIVAAGGKGGGKNNKATPYAGAINVCIGFYKTGTCAYGDRCRFSHVDPTAPPNDTDGRGAQPKAAPDAPDKTPKTPSLCKWLQRKGACRFGPKCYFRHHSEPPSRGDKVAITNGDNRRPPNCCSTVERTNRLGLRPW